MSPLEHEDLPSSPREGPLLSNEHIGDTMTAPKPQGITRLYLINMNGVTMGKYGTWDSLMQSMRDLEVDHCMFTELNLNTRQSKVASNLQARATTHFGLSQHKLTLTSSTVESATHYKQGGIASLTAGDLRGRIIATGEDKFARWNYHKMAGRNQDVITIICTYQVGTPNPRLVGPQTIIAQQLSMHVSSGVNNPYQLRQHHAHDLVQFVQECQQKGEKVIVGGDFNEELGLDPNGLTRLCSECHLLDPVYAIHQETDFATYDRGSKVIDYLLMDPSLLSAVEGCGYEPFNHHILSDHRGLFLDVDTAKFFGTETAPLAPLERRDIRGNRSHQIAPYFQALDAQYQHHKWYDKIVRLKHCIATDTPNDRLAEEVDQRRIRSCIAATKNLKRYPTAPYSPAIAKQRNIVVLLKLLLHQATGRYDYSESIARRQQLLGPASVSLPSTADQIRAKLRLEKKHLAEQETQERMHRTMRDAHLADMIETSSNAGNNAKAKLLRRLRRAEEVSRVFRKCAAARNKLQEGGLNHVLVPRDPGEDPKQCTEWRRIDDPPEITATLEARNQAHFGQSKNCNLTSPPLDITMDFEGSCAKAEAILNGTYPQGDLNEPTRWLLDNLQYVSEPNAVQATLTRSDFIDKIKVWNERTSTSPLTNVHLGHAKAYIAHHGISADTEAGQQAIEDLESVRNSCLDGHLTLLQYALHFGYSYTRWQSIVNAMLEKIPGNPYIHKLRVIHLYEWDFNLILGVKWRQLLHHICDNGWTNWSAYGSTPGCDALSPAFLRELEYEMCRITQKPLVQFDNDAASCYDRIPCFLANVASRKYGLDAKVCMVQGRTLKEAKYYLKTKLGISEHCIVHSRELPWFGTGQGSGNSPTYWLLIVTTLSDIYDSKAKGATYVSPTTALEITIKLLSFVDDTNNRTNDFTATEPPSREALINFATHDSQLWHDILTSTNQTLELSKCSYHYIHFDFKETTGEPYMVLEDTNPVPLVIESATGPTTIEFKPSNKASKYLGCMKAPANQEAQKKEIEKKCKDFAKVVNCSNLSRKEARALYHAIYLPSVGYPLPLCWFTESECSTMQKQSHPAMLRRMGYHRNFPKAVTYGPPGLGGLGLYHLYDIQGMGQLQFFLKFWRSPHTQQGKLLRITLHWAQYSVGTSTPILLHPQQKLPHLASKWITSLRNYLAAIEATIEVDSPGVAPLLREHDSHIMDHALQHYGPAAVKRISLCCRYMNVQTVSDIATADGSSIDTNFLQGKDFRAPLGVRIHQKRPGTAAWKAWGILCRKLANGKNNILVQPLGSWICKPQQLRHKWPFWRSSTTHILYQQSTTGFQQHRRMLHDFDNIPEPQTVQSLPPDAYPVDIKARPGSYSILNKYHTTWLVPPTSSPPWNPLLEPTTETMWLHVLQSRAERLVPHAELRTAFASGKVILVSDGSAPNSQGSFGWILSHEDGTRLAWCNGAVAGYRSTSYRAEGFGILSGLLYIHLYRRNHHITVEWQWELLCDNLSMIEKVQTLQKHQRDPYPNTTLAAEYDVLAQIQACFKDMEPSNKPTLLHIKGHQDDDTPYERLPIRAQLNVDADRLAAEYLDDHPDGQYTTTPLFPASGATIHTPDGSCTYKYKANLRLLRHTPSLKAYLMKRNHWTEEAFLQVDWEVHRLALARTQQHSTTMHKHIHNWLPVGSRKKHYDPKYPAACPTCQAPDETSEHFLLCSHPSRQQWKRTFLQNLRKYLTDQHTSLDATVLITDALDRVLHGNDLADLAVPRSLEAAATSQASIGWDQLLKGRLSVEWQAHHQQHLGPRATKKKNGLSWSISLASHILQQWYTLWELRNQDEHGRDAATKAQAAHRQALHEVELLFSQQHKVPEPYQHWYSRGQDFICQQNVSYIRAWISALAPIVAMEEAYATRLETG